MWYVWFLIIAWICLDAFMASKASDVAEDKGYNKRTWFHLCFWLGIVFYIVIAALPDLTMYHKIDKTNELLLTMHQKMDETNKLLRDLLQEQKQNKVQSANNKSEESNLNSFLPEL